MDLPLTALAVLGGAALVALWVVHLRRDLARRGVRSADYDGLDSHGELWTTAARCPECRAAGALLAREGEELWHTCMACGHRHRREHRG